MVIYFSSLVHLRIYELAADIRLYLDAGEKKDLEARLQGMIPLSEVAIKLKEIEDAEKNRLAELEAQKEAFTKLSAEVQTLKSSHNAHLERALAEQAERHKAEVAALKESLATAEENATQARLETTTLQNRAKDWKVKHSTICRDLNGKLLFFHLIDTFPIRIMFCNQLSCPNPSAAFPDTQIPAETAVRIARGRRMETMPVGTTEWDIKDYLESIKARLSPLKRFGDDLLKAATHVHKALWPEDPSPQIVSVLAERLAEGNNRL